VFGGCLVDGDCASRQCLGGAMCVQASGPPSWVALTPPSPGNDKGASMGYEDGEIVLAGGGSTPRLVEQYDVASDTWVASSFVTQLTEDTDMAGMSSCSRFDQPCDMFVVGNFFAAGAARISVLGNKSLSISYFPDDTAAYGGGVLFGGAALPAGGGAYLFGGGQGSSPFVASPQPDGEQTDGSTWDTSTIDLSSPRFGHAGAWDSDGRKIYMLGGMVDDAGSVTASAEVWDQAGGATSFASLPGMSSSRYLFAAAGAPDRRVYAIGGVATYNGSELPSVEAYDPAVGAWEHVVDLPANGGYARAVVVPDGRIFVYRPLVNTFFAYYGPKLTPSASSGSSVSLSGSNFAAGANVAIYVETTQGFPTDTPVATTTTDGAGVLAPVTVDLSAQSPGVHYVIAVDDRSLYPATARFVRN
jgi:hypothetical protein